MKQEARRKGAEKRRSKRRGELRKTRIAAEGLQGMKVRRNMVGGRQKRQGTEEISVRERGHRDMVE